MLGIVGQSVLLGIDSLVPSLANVNPIETVRLMNADYSHWYVDRNVLSNNPIDIPTEWSGSSVMNAIFETLNAGNLSYLSQQIDKILVKRQRIDEPYAESTWTTLFEIPIEPTQQSRLTFTVNDFTNVYGATYVYQLVPVIVQGEASREGTGQNSKEVKSVFDGVFICSRDDFVKLYAGVEYGNMTTNQITGVHQTLGSQYPIVVANSKINYHNGSIAGTVVNKDYGKADTNGVRSGLDEQKIIQARKELDEFLVDKSPKIVKDSAGNAWLVVFTDNVDYTFFNAWGKSLGNISASWTEIGDPTSNRDLSRTGFTGEV